MPAFSRRIQGPPAGFFNACIAFQLSTTEIVVYSLSVGQFVVIAWPMSNGRRILPQGLRAWLRSRGLHWDCYCSLWTATPQSTHIVHSLAGEVLAFCHSTPSVCGFHLNLSNIHRTALLESDYENLPTLASRQVPSMDAITRAFLTSMRMEDGPYFQDYCGEHESMYPGTSQLAGTINGTILDLTQEAPVASSSRTLDFAAARTRRRAALDNASAIAWASITAPLPSSRASTRRTARPSRLEVEMLSRLERGRGITEFEHQGFFEQCGFCRRYFLGSLLCRHLIICTVRPR